MKRKCIFLFALLAAFIVANADELSKQRKIAAKVWEMEPAIFDSKVTVPDILLQNNSAVIIALMVDIEGSIEKFSTPYSRDGLGNSNCCVEISRTMVMILDDKAQEYYTDFEYGELYRKVHGVRLTEVNSEFGARVIKPDGSVVDVDLATALKVGHGKKGNKNESRRIAIPGLEIGDILDYYYMTTIEREEADIPVRNILLGRQYPIMNFVLNGRFDPQLTVEVKARNGASIPVRGRDNAIDRNTIKLTANSIPAIDNDRYSNVSRTCPSIDISILNNVSVNVRHLPTARVPGVHTAVPFGIICRDIASVVSNFNIYEKATGEALNMVKGYMKKHPELTDRQVVDIAWVALCCWLALDKKISADDIVAGCLFMDLVRKLKLFDDNDMGLAFYKSRFDKPFDEVSRWTELDYGTLVGDTVYTLSSVLNFAPGEWSGSYQGEKGAVLKGKRSMLDENFIPELFTLPKLRATANSIEHEATAMIVSEDETISIDCYMKVNGAPKAAYGMFTNQHEWLVEVENLFDIPANKRHKPKSNSDEKRKGFIDNMVIEEAEWAVGTRPKSVESYEILSRGVMPGSKAFELKSKCTLDGLVAERGSAMFVSVGHMFYNTLRINGDARYRTTAAWLKYPENIKYRLTLNIPVGYRIEEDALKSLSNNILTKVGQFYTTARLNEDGNSIVIDMIKRINIPTIPSKNWEDFLKIEDAAAAFNETVIPLTRI